MNLYDPQRSQGHPYRRVSTIQLLSLPKIILDWIIHIQLVPRSKHTTCRLYKRLVNAVHWNNFWCTDTVPEANLATPYYNLPTAWNRFLENLVVGCWAVSWLFAHIRYRVHVAIYIQPDETNPNIVTMSQEWSSSQDSTLHWSMPNAPRPGRPTDHSSVAGKEQDCP